MALSKKDFDYYKGWIRESEAEHKKKIYDQNKP